MRIAGEKRPATIVADAKGTDQEMTRPKGTDPTDPNRQKLTWPGALAFWVVVSAIGWLAIVGLVVALGTGDVDQIAIEKEDGEVEIAPASGPDGENSPPR